MEVILRQLAATAESTEEKSDILSSLGIDWTLLLLQVIAFMLLLWALRKFVYPIFMKIIDERQEKIDASTRAADEVKKAADSASEEVAKLLTKAKHEAADIVAIAKTEAAAMVDTAEAKAKAKSESIIASARDDIDREVAAARDTLYNDMIDLVTEATTKVLGAHVTAEVDSQLIKSAVEKDTL